MGMLKFGRRHEAGLMATGALIVFAAYFMKEGVRDSTKDFTSALDHAREVYRTDRNLEVVRIELLRASQLSNPERLLQDQRLYQRVLSSADPDPAELESVVHQAYEALRRKHGGDVLAMSDDYELYKKFPRPFKEIEVAIDGLTDEVVAQGKVLDQYENARPTESSRKREEIACYIKLPNTFLRMEAR